jgi:hypothetical protein
MIIFIESRLILTNYLIQLSSDGNRYRHAGIYRPVQEKYNKTGKAGFFYN